MDETKREEPLAGEHETVKAQSDQPAGKKGKKEKKKKTVGQSRCWMISRPAAVPIPLRTRGPLERIRWLGLAPMGSPQAMEPSGAAQAR